jgi:hypothetical protein
MDGKKTDIELMKRALRDFEDEARDKFLRGIEEHNSDGTNGMCRMSKKQTIEAIKDEIMDLWFYVKSLEEKEDS